MQEKVMKVWEEIENAIGTCCLHKKAAYFEVSGKKVQQLTMVTSAPVSAIRNFIGEREVEEKQKNRFLFTHEGVQVDLTTYCDIEDVDEIYRRSFRQLLSVDSIGVRRDGMVTSLYNGVDDVHNKILRLTDENAEISEGLYRRMLMLYASEGYSFDGNLRIRLEHEQLFAKEGYRKKFCEIFVANVLAERPDWKRVARMLEIPGCALSHKPSFGSYIEKITEADKKHKRTLIFLIMALLKITSKELHSLMQDVPEVDYYDSLCTYLTTRVDNCDTFRKLRDRYGDDFLDLLYDLQELWVKDIEGKPFRRYTERDFDKMGLVASDENLWFNRNNPVKITRPVVEEKPTGKGEVRGIPSNDVEDPIEMVGIPDYSKIMGPGYTEEDFSEEEEPTEGPVVDDYVMPSPNPEETVGSSTDELDVLPASVEGKSSVGFDAAGLDQYENGGFGNRGAQMIRKEPVIRGGGAYRPGREHKSSMINGNS